VKTRTQPRSSAAAGVRMPRNFLVYWRPQTVEYQFRLNIPLDHAGSEQFDKRVQPGDTLWMVTSRDGVLFLLGRLIVGAGPMTRAAAIRRLGRTNLWDATRHVVAADETAAPLQQIALNGVAADLAFQSARAPRLRVMNGRVNPQSLQRMRELRPESVALLSGIWHHAGQPPLR
jgi:hypothetical protein